MYADDLILCGELEEDLRTMVGHFVEVCVEEVKVNAGKNKVMRLNGEEELECEVCVDGMCQNLNIWDVLDESGTDEAECRRKVVSWRRLQMLLGLWLMLEVCSLTVLGSCMRHCSCLFLCMVVRQDMEGEGKVLD